MMLYLRASARALHVHTDRDGQTGLLLPAFSFFGR